MAAAAGAPTVAINTGNPRYPYPMFQSYGVGRGNLANLNPAGVPHAEQEEWGRDAWQIFANEFTYTGQVVGGVQYIRANNGCPYDCTEGDGYALIAAAYMADKTTFDGIWMRFHDTRLRRRARYSDGVVANAGYLYGNTPMDNADSAADGDFDAALGILMAWYQWGDDSGIPISGGGTMNYRTEAEYAIRAIAEKYRHFPVGDCRVTTGHIGFDGYVKAGNTWGERTNWANGCPNPQFNGPDGPEFGGSTGAHIDYIAPSYFRTFGDFLMNPIGLPAASFEVTQYRRAEASSDWLMGQLIAQGPNAIPVAGGLATLTAASATFLNENSAEDARMPWRTILNYVWNGNATTTWNPNTKVVGAGANTWEYNAGVRHATFLNNPQGAPWNNPCQAYGGAPGLTFRGAPTVNWTVNMNGSGSGSFNLNWLMGSGAPAAVAAQNYDLMAELYRQCTIEWDVTDQGDGYLTSKPFYFHGFFRWLGMDILSGNHPNPSNLVQPGSAPPSNLKIYKSVDRTYAFSGDTLTYWLNYRNYASTTATGVRVIDTLPAELAYVSSSYPAGGSVSTAGNVVTWNLPNLNGFVTGGLANTMRGITLVARVIGTTGRFCNTSDISTSNGSGWTSNEYPNEVSMVMKRNCVDIVPEVMSLTKTAAPATACPGDRVTFTLNYRDNPGAWINGGRPDVTVSFGHDTLGAADNQLSLRFRLMHAADEPYIDYGNYRISYFVNDATNAPTNWNAMATICEGCGTGAVFSGEALPPGPTWNQRWIIRFGSQMAAPAIHLYNYTGLYPRRIHRGGTGGQYVMRGTWMMNTISPTYANYNQLDDWSADPGSTTASDGDWGFPIGNDWTAGDGTSTPVTRIHPDACQTASHTVTNVLVEEWDGYTWRRAFGNGPVAGRQLANMTITDVLPACMTFGGFIGTPAGVTATAVGQTVTFSKASVNINESGSLQFWVTMGSCGGPVDNTATMAATGEKPISSTVTINPGGACGGTPTRTPTITPSPTRSATPSLTRTGTPSPSGTPSPTYSATRTATASPSASRTATASATGTATRSATPTPSSTQSPASSPTYTPTATPTATRTTTPSSTPSVTPSLTPTATPSRTATLSASPSASVTASMTPSGTRTATLSQTPSVTATPSRTATPSFTVTFLDTYTVSPTISPTPSATRTATASVTPSASRTASASLTASPSQTLTGTPSATRSASPSATLSSTISPIASPTVTSTITPTATESPVFTLTVTSTATPTSTVTRTVTPSSTRSASPSATLTATESPAFTLTVTSTATPSSTATRTRTSTPSVTSTPSATSSQTPGPSPTYTVTPSATRTASPTATATRSATPTLSYSSTRTETPLPLPTSTWSATPSITPTPSISPTFSTTVTRLPNFYQQQDLVKERGIYPNPFSDRVRIYFTLRVAGEAKLTIYNVAGEPIFVRGYPASAGKNEILWDGMNDVGGRCASGVYILRLQATGLDGTTGAYWASMAIQR